MKRLTALFAAAVILLSACGGNEKSQEEDQSSTSSMTIVQTQFSDETEDILKLLDIKGGFFEFSVDKTVNGFSMNVWVLTDGKWVSSGEIKGKIENGQGRVGVQLLEDGCSFFELDDTGHTKYSVKYDTHLEECTATMRQGLKDQGAPILPGQEQYLFLEMGWKDPTAEMQMMENFRTSNCDAGVAATITFTAAPDAA